MSNSNKEVSVSVDMDIDSIDKEGFITIQEGIYKGVSYKIINAEFIDKDGHHFLEFDYDVHGIDDGVEKEFEKYLGEFLINALKWAVEQDAINGGKSE